MNVYLVYQDNGECYEDYYEWVERIFTSYELAQQYIESIGFEKRENRRGEQRWARDIREADPENPDEYFNWGIETSWIVEMSVEDELPHN